MQQPIRWLSRNKLSTPVCPEVAPDVWPFGNPEVAAFAAGLKPALKLEDLTPREGRTWWNRKDLPHGGAGALQDQRKLPTPESRLLAGKASGVKHPFTLFLANGGDNLKDLLRAEREQRAGGPLRTPAIRMAGNLLGYPSCCTAAFSELPRQDDPVVVAAYGSNVPTQSMVRPLAAASALLNFFPPLAGPVTWYPCSFSCPASLASAKASMGLLSTADSLRLHEFLSGVVLAFDKFRFVHLHGAQMIGNRLCYESVSDALSAANAPLALSRSAKLKAFRRQVTQVFAHARELVFGNEKIELLSPTAPPVCGLLLEPVLAVWFPSPGDVGGGS